MEFCQCEKPNPYELVDNLGKVKICWNEGCGKPLPPKPELASEEEIVIIIAETMAANKTWMDEILKKKLAEKLIGKIEKKSEKKIKRLKFPSYWNSSDEEEEIYNKLNEIIDKLNEEK